MRLNNSICFILLLCMLLTGCVRKSDIVTYNKYVDEKEIDGYNVTSDYDFSLAEKDGFVIIKEDEVINEDKIDEFYEKTMNHEEASLTIVRYTLDDEEIVIQYVYKDEVYTVFIDNTRDKSEDGKVIVRTIKDIDIDYDDKGHKIIVEKY